MSKKRFKIIPAVYLVLIQDNKLLLGKRVNTGFMDGMYSLVAGHIDKNESAVGAMIREAKEEINIEIEKGALEMVYVMNRIDEFNAYEEEGVKYPVRVDYFFKIKNWRGEIENMEKDRCEELEWFDLDDLPDNLVDYVKTAIEDIKNGIKFREIGWE